MHVRGVARTGPGANRGRRTAPSECFKQVDQAGVFDMRADRRGRAPEHGADHYEQQANRGPSEKSGVPRRPHQSFARVRCRRHRFRGYAQLQEQRRQASETQINPGSVAARAARAPEMRRDNPGLVEEECAVGGDGQDDAGSRQKFRRRRARIRACSQPSGTCDIPPISSERRRVIVGDAAAAVPEEIAVAGATTTSATTVKGRRSSSRIAIRRRRATSVIRQAAHQHRQEAHSTPAECARESQRILRVSGHPVRQVDPPERRPTRPALQTTPANPLAGEPSASVAAGEAGHDASTASYAGTSAVRPAAPATGPKKR